MGYLIKQPNIKREIIIPEADVLLLGTTPFGYNILTQLVSNQAYGIKSCYISNLNIAGNYTGFQHIYLQDGNASVLGVYEENLSIAYQFLLYMNIGSSHPPSKFGGGIAVGSNGGLYINFSNTATGSGDLKVYIEYSIVNK